MATRVQTDRLHGTMAVVVAALGAGVAQVPLAADAETTLEELVVTAQRRNEDLQNTGLAVSVLNEEDLIDKSVFGLTAMQYAAPSVSISDFGSANVFSIRGIGRSQVDFDLPSGVVIYRDGAPTLAGYFQNEPYFDMASVELLRGPQGTFVGKSAAGGAVFINTRDPELGRSSARLEVGGGNFDLAEVTAVGNLGVSDTLALRVAYNHLQRNDYYDRIYGDFTGNPGERNLDSIRAGVSWVPIERLNVLLKVDYSDLDFGGNVTSSFGDPLFDVEQNAHFAYTDESFRAVLDISYDLGNGVELRSLTGYQDVETTNNSDLNGSEPLYYEFNSHGDVKIYSQELNVVSPEDGPLQWIVGAFYEKQETDIPYWDEGGFAFIGNGFAPDYPWASSPWQREDEDWAVFAQLSLAVTDALELDLGARYSDYQLDQFTEWTFGLGDSPPLIPWPFSVPPASPGGDRQSLSEDSVDWKVGLNWAISADHFGYGLISRGHVTGGINVFPPFFPYDEMEVFNYEVGWKANWAEGRLRTQANLFYQTFDNYQARFANPGVGPASILTFRNADSTSDIYGAEASGQAVFGDWGFDVGFGWLHSELGTFEDVVSAISGDVIDLTGAEPPFSPEFTANLGVEYTFRLGAGLMLRPRIDYAYISEQQSDLYDEDYLILESRDVVNLQVRLTPADGRWYANAWMTNAADEGYVAAIQNTGTLRYAAPPRQYGLRVGFNW